MYSCEVLEFGVSVEIGLAKRILYIDCYSFYDDKGRSIKEININRFDDSIAVKNDEIWINFSSELNNRYAKKIDPETLEFISMLPHSYSNAVAKVEDKYFEVVGRRDGTKIVCLSEGGNGNFSSVPWLKYEIFSYKGKLFAFDRQGNIYCFDSELHCAWSVKNSKQTSSTNLNLYHPIFFNDAIICNIGRDDTDGESDFHICAYNLITGEIIWNVVLESPLQSVFLVGDCLYIATQKYFYKVNAINGHIEIKHEFLYETFDGKEAAISAVYPVKDGLLCFNHQNHFVELRSEDAKAVLQTIKLPETYSYAFLSSPPVFEHDGKYYFKLDHLVLGLNPMKSGVAILTPDDNAPQNHDAVLEARPPYSIEVIKSASGKNEHLMKIKGDDHNKILRYAHVILKEIAFKSGVTRLFEFESRDKSHGGMLNLEIDTSDIDEKQALEYWKDFFDVIKQRVESELKDSHVLAGDGESNFHVNLRVK